MEMSFGSWTHAGRRCLTAVIRDVSDRVDARRALREAEQRFAGAFEGAAVGLALAAPDGTLLRANRALCDLAGVPEGELIGPHARRAPAPGGPRRGPRRARRHAGRQDAATRHRAPSRVAGRRHGRRPHQPLAHPRRRRRAAALRRADRGRHGAPPDARGAHPLAGPLQDAPRPHAGLGDHPLRPRAADADGRGRAPPPPRPRYGGDGGPAPPRGDPGADAVAPGARVPRRAGRRGALLRPRAPRAASRSGSRSCRCATPAATSSAGWPCRAT